MAFFTDNTGTLPDFNPLKRAYPFDTSDKGPALSPLPNIPLISDQDAIKTWSFANTCFGSVNHDFA